MKAKTLVFGVAAAGGGALLLGRLKGSRWAGRVVDSGSSNGATRANADRWHVVTVNRPSEEVSQESRLPGPLAELGDKIELRFRPAPGDRGTEIAARVKGPVPSGLGGAAARVRGDDPRLSLRKALREARSLMEIGEVLSPDKPPTTKDTPGGKLVGLVTSRGRGEGLL